MDCFILNVMKSPQTKINKYLYHQDSQTSYNVFLLYMNYHYSLYFLLLTQLQIALSLLKNYCLHPI